MGQLREKIFGTVDIEREIVIVWGEDVEVRTMNGADRSDYVGSLTLDGDTINRKHMYANVIIWTCYVPGTDDKVFAPEDRDAILAKSAKETGKLFEAALRLAGLTNGAVEAVKNGSPARGNCSSIFSLPIG
jgi:hypothetical protein